MSIAKERRISVKRPKDLHPSSSYPTWFQRWLTEYADAFENRVTSALLKTVNGLEDRITERCLREVSRQDAEAFQSAECACENRKDLERYCAMWFENGVPYRSVRGEKKRYDVCDTCGFPIWKPLIKDAEG